MNDPLPKELLNLDVSPEISEPMPIGLGFPRARILSIYDDRTDTEFVRWEDLEVVIVARAYNSFTEMAGIGISTDHCTAVFGFRVFPDLCEKPLSDFSPLQIVKLMAERFGLMMTIGDETGKFFSKQEVDISTAARAGFVPGQLIRVENPENRPYTLSHAVKYEGNLVQIALAFSLDTASYWQWISDR